MKKLILAVSLLMANLVQANDTPAHPFDTRAGYRFHPIQHRFHQPVLHRPMVFHGIPPVNHLPAVRNASLEISMPDFKQADLDMNLSSLDDVRISMPDLKTGELDMLIPGEAAVEISMPDISGGEQEMLQPFGGAARISVPGFAQSDADMQFQ